MDEEFMKTWLHGFEQGLDELTPEGRSCLLKGCAKCCADTGVLTMYRDLFQKVNGDRDEFYTRVHELGGARAEIVRPGKEYYLYFPECYCDLHLSGRVNSVNLCECSRQSIIYIGEQLWRTGSCQVECMGTILGGYSECKFKVTFES